MSANSEPFLQEQVSDNLPEFGTIRDMDGAVNEATDVQINEGTEDAFENEFLLDENPSVDHLNDITSSLDPEVLRRLCRTAGISSSYIDSIAKDSNPFIAELLLKIDHLIHPSNGEEESIVSLQASLTELKSQKLKISVDFEQKAHSIETKYRSIVRELEVSKERLQSAVTQNDSTQTRIAQLQQELAVSKNQLVLTKQELESLKSSSETIDDDKRNVIALLERRQQDLDCVNEECTILRAQSESYRTEIHQLRSKNAELEGTDVSRKHLLESREQELLQSKKHGEWLSDELNRKNEEFRRYRTEKNEEVSSLQIQVSSLTQENQSLETKSHSLQSRGTELESRLETSITRAEELENRIIIKEQQFRNEILGQTKLADLYAKQCEDIKSRNLDLEKYVRDMEVHNQEAQDLIQNAERENAERFNELRNALEEKEIAVEKLSAELRVVNESLKGTASNDFNVLSDTATAASRLQKSGKTFTQVYSEHAALQEELIKEKREVVRLTGCLDHILKELTENAPMITQLKEDNESAKSEINKMKNQVAAVIKEKDMAQRSVSEFKARAASLDQENKNLQQDCKDLAKQVQVLLIELETARGGIESLDEGMRVLERTAAGHDINISSDAHDVISERLVAFHSIQDLQSQNQKMRRSLRSLAKQLEDKSNENIEIRSQEIQLAKEALGQMQEQLRVQALKCESFIRERDQWKRIAETRGIPSARSSPGEINTVEDKEETDRKYQVLYRQLQNDYDAYRKEIGIDSKALKEDLEHTKHEKNELNIHVAKLTSQLGYQQERYQSVVQSLQVQSKEQSELRDRMAKLSDTITRQDAKAQQLTSQIIESKDELESVRTEVRQLRVEKEIIRHSEARLISENKLLVLDRSRTQEMLRDVQKMYEDLERNSSDAKRKFEERIDREEKELAIARKQVHDYVDELRGVNSRREIESKEFRVKLEKLTAQTQQLSQDLAVSKAKEDNASQKVHELNARLATTEEKLHIYEIRSTSSSTVTAQSSNDSARSLELQLADIRGELESAKESLRLEREKVDTYKGISMASEEQLAHINSTYDTYKETMDTQLSEAQIVIKDLEAKCEDLGQRLSRAASEVLIAQERAYEERSSWEAEKKQMQLSLSNAQLSERNAVNDMQSAREDLNRQLLVVQEAQTNYEREVVSHSKNIQALATLREEFNALRQTNHDLEHRARLAESNDTISKKALQDIQAQFKLQSQELTDRIEELVEQNNVLHSHLEKINTKAFQLQDQAVDSISRCDTAVEPLDALHEELRDVVRFLRREKDILATKHELVCQENERTKLQIDHVQRSLDETRAVLNEERQKSVDALDGERKHVELLEKINQLNILRESNVTLRDQNEHNARKITELQQKINQAEETIGPLKVRVLNLEAELSSRGDEIKALEEDNSRWKARTQQILSKYERIDPVEHQRLIEENEKLRLEAASIDSTLAALRKEHEQDIAKMNDQNEKNDNFVKKSKAMLMRLQGEIKLKEAEISKLKEASATAGVSTAEVAHLKKAIKALDETNKHIESELVMAKKQIDDFNQKKTVNVERYRQNTKILQEKLTAAEAQVSEYQDQVEKVKSAPSAETLRRQITDELNLKWTLKFSKAEQISQSLRAQNQSLESKIATLEAKVTNEKSTASTPLISEATEVQPKTPKRRLTEEDTNITKKIRTLEETVSSEEVLRTVEPSTNVPVNPDMLEKVTIKPDTAVEESIEDLDENEEFYMQEEQEDFDQEVDGSLDYETENIDEENADDQQFDEDIKDVSDDIIEPESRDESDEVDEADGVIVNIEEVTTKLSYEEGEVSFMNELEDILKPSQPKEREQEKGTTEPETIDQDQTFDDSAEESGQKNLVEDAEPLETNDPSPAGTPYVKSSAEPASGNENLITNSLQPDSTLSQLESSQIEETDTQQKSPKITPPEETKFTPKKLNKDEINENTNKIIKRMAELKAQSKQEPLVQKVSEPSTSTRPQRVQRIVPTPIIFDEPKPIAATTSLVSGARGGKVSLTRGVRGSSTRRASVRGRGTGRGGSV